MFILTTGKHSEAAVFNKRIVVQWCVRVRPEESHQGVIAVGRCLESSSMHRLNVDVDLVPTTSSFTYGVRKVLGLPDYTAINSPCTQGGGGNVAERGNCTCPRLQLQEVCNICYQRPLLELPDKARSVLFNRLLMLHPYPMSMFKPQFSKG